MIYMRSLGKSHDTSTIIVTKANKSRHRGTNYIATPLAVSTVERDLNRV